MPESAHTLVRCLALCDGRLSVAGSHNSPAAVLVEHPPEGGLVVLAVGQAGHVERHPAAPTARRLDRLDSVLIPGLINAHTHLDLTVIGPQPHDPSDGFVHWVNQIRTGRPTDPGDIAASVGRGATMSRAGGVAAVGDIAGAVNGAASLCAAEALRDAGLAGISFVEFFAIGSTERERADAAIDLMRTQHGRFTGRHRLGLQPHATNTVSREAYRRALAAAAELGAPTMTHLAESPEEQRFVGEAAGPQRRLLEDLGLWTDALAEEFGQGRSPIEQLAPVLNASGTIAVHVNQCSDADLALLAETGTPVVYCPRASAYFGAERHFGPHRYRDMIDAGLTVAVGTDSIVNLPEGTDRLSPLDEIRFLHARDAADAMTLVRMVTINGADVLGLGESAACLAPESRPLALAAVPVADRAVTNPARSILVSDAAPRIVLE